MTTALLREEALEAFRRGERAPLEQVCLEIIRYNPTDPFAINGLGVLEASRGNYQQAITRYQAGLADDPGNLDLNANLAVAFCETRQWEEAYSCAKKIIALDVNYLHAWTTLSWAGIMTGRLEEGEAAARHVLSCNPQNRAAWNNLGSALKEQGKIHEAVLAYQHAREQNPDYDTIYINLMLTLQYDLASSLKDIVTTAFGFATQFEAPLIASWPRHATAPFPWRKLRIGLLSPDFNNHSVMNFAEPLIARLDRQQFEVICYYLYPEGSGDWVTERVQRMADRFVYLGGKKPDEQAALIQTDAVDILIDLAGHTAKSGLLAMARKPAPVQMTWLGYPGTTGLTAIDWRITDNVADAEPPVESGLPVLKEQYSEKLAFLPPPFCVYRPCIRYPLQRYHAEYQVKPAPAVRNGFITFGSCNNIAKLTPNVLTVWGKLLQRMPDARLLIEGKGFEAETAASAFREKCAEHGIPTDRLELLDRDNKKQYLIYHRIDIALDPFPLTGGTTSFDLLWMGLPLVTMQGTSFRSRMGMSLLTAAGLAEWIARNEEEYIEIAVKLASDVPALNARRLQQRLLVESSPLMDELRFVRLFEEALRQMWMKWCARHVAGDNPAAQHRQFVEWFAERPHPQQAEPQVFLDVGERIGLVEAQQRLSVAFEAAKRVPVTGGGTVAEMAPVWQSVIRLASLILESLPKNPTALAALAEAEYAHGNLQAAISYLSHAVDAAPQAASFYPRLIIWLREAGNEQAAETIIRLMQQRGIARPL